MSKIIANMIKGFRKKFQKPMYSDNSASLGWLQEKMIKHQDNVELKNVHLNGINFYYKNPFEFLHTYKELFIAESYKFRANQNAPIIIDCGSNIGLSVLYFLKTHPQAIIHAYEPDDDNFEILKKNCAPFESANLQLHKAAVWNADGTVSFNASATEASHIVDDKSQNTKSVSCVRLKNLLLQYDTINFLKLDIEGAEWEVMQDIKNELTRVQNFFLEYHGKTMETFKLAKMMAILEGSGFQVYVQNAADSLKHPFVQQETGLRYDVQLNLYCFRKT